MIKKKEREELKKLVTVTKAIRALTKKNPTIFRKLATLRAEERKLTEGLKESVRNRVVAEASEKGYVGPSTVNVYTDKEALVQAVVRHGARGFDVGVARAEWPRAFVNACSSIDPKKVDALIEEGKLTADLAEKARRQDRVVTAAVTIVIAGEDPSW
jgi:hypothetical protein